MEGGAKSLDVILGGRLRTARGRKGRDDASYDVMSLRMMHEEMEEEIGRRDWGPVVIHMAAQSRGLSGNGFSTTISTFGTGMGRFYPAGHITI